MKTEAIAKMSMDEQIRNIKDMSTSQAVAVLRIIKEDNGGLNENVLNGLSYSKLAAVAGQFPDTTFFIDDKQRRTLTIILRVTKLFYAMLFLADIALGICILAKVGLFRALSRSLRLGIGISSVLNVFVVGLVITHLLISITFIEVRCLTVSKFADCEETKIKAKMQEIVREKAASLVVDDPPLVQSQDQSAELSS
jgi:hypothetical protein